eukprot:5277979-Pyramimonas_sp.AAC.1
MMTGAVFTLTGRTDGPLKIRSLRAVGGGGYVVVGMVYPPSHSVRLRPPRSVVVSVFGLLPALHSLCDNTGGSPGTSSNDNDDVSCCLNV